jgi:hypothetical protein
MSKHDHVKECAHELKVCAECDVAYCKKCEKEWGAPCTLNHYLWTYTSPNVWPDTGTVPYGTSITVSNEPNIYSSSAAHAHN